MPNRSLRILYVEDDDDTRIAMGRLLNISGHFVVAADSIGAAQASAANEEPFDLLITDIGLGDGNGLDLLHQLRARYPLLGIVLSGYGDSQDVAHSIDAGFQRHLIKPIMFSDLLEVINEIVPAMGDRTAVLEHPGAGHT